MRSRSRSRKNAKMLSALHTVQLGPAHEMLQSWPWLDAWRAAPGPRLPRNFIKTPFALNLLDLAPAEATFLQSCTDQPWRALQAVLRAYYSKHLLRLSAGAPLLHAVIVNDLQAVAEQARSAQLHDPSRTTFKAHLSAHTAGHTALTLAAMLGRDHAAERLLAAGAAVDVSDALGNTPLHWAQLTRNTGLRDALLAHGAPTEASNRLGALPQDCDDSWNNLPPTEFNVQAQLRDGGRRQLNDIASFRACLGFDYQPSTRPGIDFYLQLAVGQTSASWLEALHSSLADHPPLPREARREPTLYYRDDGAPWGWSVCCAEPLAAGDWVAAYTGDLIHSQETLVELLNQHSSPYLGYGNHLKAHIDAQRSGGFGSRINSAHCLGAENLGVACGFWRGLPRTEFFALRPVNAQAQLSWYYGDAYWRTPGIQPIPLLP